MKTIKSAMILFLAAVLTSTLCSAVPAVAEETQAVFTENDFQVEEAAVEAAAEDLFDDDEGDPDEDTPEMPTDYSVRFEKDIAYYNEFPAVPVEKIYLTTDSYWIPADAVLYVEGQKVPSEWEEQPAYFTVSWESSDENVIGLDYWGYTEVRGAGTATLTANIFYTPDRDKYDPAFLTSANLEVVVGSYLMTTKDSMSYNNNMMYLIGETAVVSPRLYTKAYDSDANQWIYTFEDQSDVTFAYQVDGLTEEQYVVSEDTSTLSIPDIPEGQYVVTVTASRDGAEILQDVLFVAGAQVPTLGLKYQSTSQDELILTNPQSFAGTIFAQDIGYEWGDVKFEYLDPKTKKPVTWFGGQSIAGGGSPNNALTPRTAGTVLIRASLYRDICDRETPLVTEEVEVTAYAPFNTCVVDLLKGKSFTVKPTDKIAEAGLTVSGFTSSDTSVFTVSSAGVVKAKAAGAAQLTVECKTPEGYNRNFVIPVNVYAITLSSTSVTYTGKEIKPTVTVKGPKYSYQRTSIYKEVYGFVLDKAVAKYGKSDYKVTYANNVNAGTATVKVVPKNGYCKNSTIKLTFKITKAENSITGVTTAKTIKYSLLKSKNQTFTIAATVKGKAKKTFTLTSVPTAAKKYITVSSGGKVTVKTGLKKGTYKIKVKIKAAATANYNAKTVTKTITITVK